MSNEFPPARRIRILIEGLASSSLGSGRFECKSQEIISNHSFSHSLSIILSLSFGLSEWTSFVAKMRAKIAASYPDSIKSECDFLDRQNYDREHKKKKLRWNTDKLKNIKSAEELEENENFEKENLETANSRFFSSLRVSPHCHCATPIFR